MTDNTETTDTTTSGAQAETTSATKDARRPLRRLRRIGIALLVVVAVLIGGSYAATAVMGIPTPPQLLQLQSIAPSEYGRLFPARTVPAPAQSMPLAGTEQPLPASVPWHGERISVDQFLQETKTNAFLVLREGQLTNEWYRDGIGPSTLMSSWSMAKSIVSLLVGQAIDHGTLHEADRLVARLPELITGDSAYDDITVRDLLDMNSGVDVSENYSKLWPFTGTARMLLTNDLPDFAHEHRGLAFPPGSKGAYRSIDTQLLSLVLSRAEGKPLATLLAERIWQPMGAEHDATWNLDHDNGTEKAFCCLNATARDFAKIGQLVLDSGKANAQQIIPIQWITRISHPAPVAVDGLGYSAQWWHYPGGNGTDFAAIGVYGQYTYIDPTTRTVIVKLSDYGTEQDEQATLDVMRAIAQPPHPAVG